MADASQILETAIVLHAAGYPVILTDEHKNPGVVGGNWDEYQWTAAKFADWLKRKPNLQLGLKLWPIVDIEIDAPVDDDGSFMAEALKEFKALAGEPHTPSWASRRGRHWLVRVTDEQRTELENLKCPSVLKVGRLEIRMGVGKAAQSLIPPSTTDGFRREWFVDLQAEEIASMPSSLFAALRAEAKARLAKQQPQTKVETPKDRPGDIFNQRVTWDEILTAHGWKAIEGPDVSVRHWTRPGKTHGVSATTGFCKTDNRDDCFYSFSTDIGIAPFEAQRSYSKFEAYTALNHEGNFTAASAELARRGYAPPTPDGSEFDIIPDEPESEPVSQSRSVKPPKPPKPPKETSDDFGDSVYDNPLGHYVNANDPHTEADRGSVFMQSLETFGNWIGKEVTFRLNNSTQYANGYLAIVGKTALGRKGTALNDALAPYRFDEPDLESFMKHRVQSGISSGEGLISHVADNPQFTDGRLLVTIQELHRLKAVLDRKESTLSSILREAYDGGKLSVMTRTNPLTATSAHISLIIHTTEAEFANAVSKIDILNGLLNRVMFYAASDGKALPNPGRVDPDELEKLSKHLVACREWAYNAGDGRELYWSEPAKSVWADFYVAHRDPTSDPLVDALLARTPVHVIKNSMRFAALDMSEAVQLKHLETAIAIWEKCHASAIGLLATQNPLTDERLRLLDAMQDTGGLTKSEAYRLFNNNKSAKEVNENLDYLVSEGKAKVKQQKRGNRSVQVWVSTS